MQRYCKFYRKRNLFPEKTQDEYVFFHFRKQTSFIASFLLLFSLFRPAILYPLSARQSIYASPRFQHDVFYCIIGINTTRNSPYTKKEENIWPDKRKAVSLHPLIKKVPWMSGLVNGLQNRLRRFESARHLSHDQQVRE